MGVPTIIIHVVKGRKVLKWVSLGLFHQVELWTPAHPAEMVGPTCLRSVFFEKNPPCQGRHFSCASAHSRLTKLKLATSKFFLLRWESFGLWKE